jgi:hypothetical protein
LHGSDTFEGRRGTEKKEVGGGADKGIKSQGYMG